jgi:hypothetical protein
LGNTPSHKNGIGAGFGFVSFIVAGAYLTLTVSNNLRGGLRLGPGRTRQKQCEPNKANHKPDAAPQPIRIFMTMILSAAKQGTNGMISKKPFLSQRSHFHLPPLGILVNPQQTLFNDTIVKLLQCFQIRVFVFVTGLARVGNLWILHRVFGQQGHKHMGMRVTGFFASGNAGHVAADAVGERMYGMRQVVVD